MIRRLTTSTLFPYTTLFRSYLMVGLYDDNTPGEIFVVMSKEGSTISGLMDAFSTSISLALQYGVPLKVLVNKFTRSEEHTSELQSLTNLVCRLLLEKKKEAH